MAPIANPRDFIFERVLEGTRLVPAILAADLAAIGERDVYDDAYYAAFFKASRPVLRATPHRIDQRRGGDDHRRLGGGRQAARCP